MYINILENFTEVNNSGYLQRVAEKRMEEWEVNPGFFSQS